MKLLPLFLLVTFLSVTTAQGATRTWIGNGADNKLSTPENWVQGIAPITGDDIVFPSFANQYFFTNDLSSAVTLNSVTFSGSSYACLSGGSKTLALTVNAGAHNLGPGAWTPLGQVTVAIASSLTVNAYGGSHFVFEGEGSANIWIRTQAGGSIIKRGGGTVTLDMDDSPGYFFIQQEAGRLVVYGDSSPRDNGLLVTGGTLENHSNIQLVSAIIRGSASELTGHNLNVSGRLELSAGATLTLDDCFGVFMGNPVVLDGAYLNPQFQDCEYGYNPIFYSSPTPVSGAFVNYPDGTIIAAGGRRYTVEYDNQMVNIRPVLGVPFDLDRDSRSDISTFRSSNGTWYLLSTTGYRTIQWGLPTDKPVPGDYDGDERMDLAVYRPVEGTWYILRSLDGTATAFAFGLETDIPVPRDFNGDGRTDPSVYRPGDGNWWIKQSSFNSLIRRVQYGLPGDVPVPADYNGDDRADIAIYRPSTGLWSLCFGFSCHPVSVRNTQWGLMGDRPVPADYDGDGKADVAVFRPSEGNWYLFLSSTQSPSIVNWGIATDQPVPADYDGDGRADIGIFRPSDGNWWINRSTAGVMVQQFGLSDDKPIPAAFIY